MQPNKMTLKQSINKYGSDLCSLSSVFIKSVSSLSIPKEQKEV